MQWMETFKKNGLPVVVYLTGLLLIINFVLIIYLHLRLTADEAWHDRQSALSRKVEELKESVFAAELSARDFLIRDDPASREQYLSAIEQLRVRNDSLQFFLRREKTGESRLPVVETSLSGAIKQHQDFVGIMNDDDSLVVATRAGSLPAVFDNVDQALAHLHMYDGSDVKTSLVRTIGFLQLAGVICIPFLFVMAGYTRKTRKRLEEMNRDIEESNRKYVFNSMEEVDLEDEEGVRSRLLSNLEKTAHFIQQMTGGNYDIRWEGITDRNRESNQHNIAGELIKMREQMKKVRDEDERRIWTTEGLTKFGEVIRKNQERFESLADQFITEIVKYVGARIGGLFILEEDEEGKSYLDLKSCYAYERKKYIQKRVEIGEGLVGQTYLEAMTTHLKKIPEDYLNITSGLGEVEPSELLVIPLKANGKIEGVLELASLKSFEAHQVEFLERIGEALASSVITVRTAERTRMLLETSQQQSEEMRAQEEEMRQNMEELEATQEQMSRQVSELNSLKESLEVEKNLFGALMDTVPDAIYFKDQDSRFLRVSKYLADHFGKPMEELIGKSDFDFQDESHAREAFEDEQHIMRSRQPKIDFVEKETLSNGEVHYVSTTKMPLTNSHSEVIGTFGISRDVTKVKLLELEVEEREKRLRDEEELYEQQIRDLKAELQRLKQSQGKGKGSGS